MIDKMNFVQTIALDFEIEEDPVGKVKNISSFFHTAFKSLRI